MKRILMPVVALLLAFNVSLTAADKPRKLVMIAGKPSHPPLMHEFRAGTLLLAKRLQTVPGLTVEVHTNGWVSDPKAFEGADAVFIYADGGAKHPAVVDGHLDVLRELVAKGVSVGFGHYGVEVLKDQAGKEFQDWIGGYYENAFSVNPIWEADYKSLPKHPITSGVK
ncbi:MAG TPA: hypothetical protein VK968_10295, partial [Roseimicrobium sp.]|nr:hypothetical protein [Roseimicrobium sp.]